MAKTTQSARSAVELELGRPIPDQAWNQVVDDGYEFDIESELLSPREVADRIRNYASVRDSARLKRGSFRGLGPEPEPLPGAQLLRQRGVALGAWAARATRSDLKVKHFRQRHLRERTLNDSEIHDWVVDAYRRGLPIDWPVSGEPTVGEAFYHAKREVLSASTAHVEFDWAELEPSGDWVVGRWPVPTSSPLAELVDLSQRLASWWKWDTLDAFLFVLTDEPVPVVPLVATSHVQHNYNIELWGGYDAFSRVNLELDPVVTPEQLAAYWRELRHKMLTTRYRPLSEKHLRLAEFMADRGPASTWDEDRVAWNAKTVGSPHWNYSNRRNFRRDAALAVKRLLYVGIKRPSD